MIKVLEAWIVTLENSCTEHEKPSELNDVILAPPRNLSARQIWTRWCMWLLTEIVPLDLLLHKKVTTITYSEINNTLALVCKTPWNRILHELSHPVKSSYS